MKTIIARLVALLMFAIGGGAQAGIPTIDVTNIVQTTTTAIESVSQTAKQIADYQLQLQQYENMIRNTVAPAAYIWDQAQQTIGNLSNAMNTLNYYKNQAGGIENYLDKFKDTNYYRQSPCFKMPSNGCTAEEWQKVQDQQNRRSESIKRSNDALIRSLDLQQQSLDSDARQLQRLQQTAQGADGQMAAIQSASMIAANSGNQLLQIRGLLIAQHTAAAAQAQADADEKAMRAAATDKLIGTTVTRITPARQW